MAPHLCSLRERPTRKRESLEFEYRAKSLLNRSSARYTAAVGAVLVLIQSRARLSASAKRVFSSVLVSWLVQAQTAHVGLIVKHYELYQNH